MGEKVFQEHHINNTSCMLTMPQRRRYGKAKKSIIIAEIANYEYCQNLLRCIIQTGKKHAHTCKHTHADTHKNARTHKHTHSECYSVVLCQHCLEIQPPLWSCTAENPVFFKASFAKWNTRQEPQQVNSRSAQETAVGSGVKQQCLEMQKKAFQKRSLPVQEKCKLQLSRTDRLLSSTLWHPVALVKGNSTQSLSGVKCAPISFGATTTKDFNGWPHWLGQ